MIKINKFIDKCFGILKRLSKDDLKGYTFKFVYLIDGLDEMNDEDYLQFEF